MFGLLFEVYQLYIKYTTLLVVSPISLNLKFLQVSSSFEDYPMTVT